MKSWKRPLIIGIVAVAVILMCIFGVQSAQNGAIGLQEAIEQADSDIKVQEKARVDKVYNLADCVKQYDKHESETLMALAESMSIGSSVEDVNTMIVAVTYAYPELKTNENYQTLMKELALIENTLAQYRENYNKSITAYNRYVKRFPTRNFLDWTGYDIREFERLDYQAPIDSPTDLFED